ncbi:MAG: hypothetical protein COV73_00460 [Candidatus Omnitrophica bacterium CG11_big_fil_rev_8_21_14_0_20_43_6]|nr:MAG: hypothetical protein COV73_00460 [Candidatus Omnitrophica bacterium CG11_big_fil_rev_8_21_14_0_20_43_6]
MTSLYPGGIIYTLQETGKVFKLKRFFKAGWFSKLKKAILDDPKIDDTYIDCPFGVYFLLRIYGRFFGALF